MSDVPQQSTPRRPGARPGLSARWPFVVAAIISAMAWLFYLLAAVFKIDVSDLLNPHNRDPYARQDQINVPLMYLSIAIGMTFAATIWAFFKSRKIRRLSAVGVSTDGTIVSKSLLRRNGMCPATIAYSVDGVEYQTRRDVAGSANEGDSVKIIYDPKNPKRCEVV